MNRSQMLHHLQGLSQSVLSIFGICPIDRLEFAPSPGVRSLLELGNHFAAMPLVELAAMQESPAQVVEAIEEALHGAGPEDWIEIFARGGKAVEEYFEGMTEEEFETKVTRAHFGAAHPQCLWLLELLGHIHHHRGQLYTYLRTLHVPVSPEYLYF